MVNGLSKKENILSTVRALSYSFKIVKESQEE